MPDGHGRELPDEARLRLFRIKDLPPAPGILQETIRVISDEKADLREISAVIDRSPELVARILRCANSSYYGQRRRIVTVEEAIIRVLGLSTTKGLIVGLALSKSFNLRSCPTFQAERHWFVSVVTADLAEKFTAHLEPPLPLAPGTAYAAGLLHNLGLLALVHSCPEKMSSILTSTIPSEAGERIREEFGFGHREAGARLALKWGLPDLLVRVIEHHGDADYRGAGWKLATLIGLAKEVAEALYDGASPTDCPLAWPADLTLPLGPVEKVVERMHEDLAGLLELAAELTGKGR